jgi:flagellar hook-associated protein 2
LTALNAGGGIDTNNLATSLVNAEKVPQQNIIDAAKTAANTTISSVGKVKSSLTALQNTLTALGDAKSFQTTANSSDTSKVTVAFKTGVTPPTFSNSIDVQQIATATTVLLPAVSSQDGSLLGTVGTSRTFSLVSGSVQNSVVSGVAMSLPSTTQTGTMTINGITTASFTLGTTSLSDNRKAVVAAVNAIASQTGVSAVDNGDDTLGVTLTAGDGRAISTSFIPAGSTESANVTFKDMVAGSSLTLGGLTFTASTDMTDLQVAAAFANRLNGVSGSGIGTYVNGTASGVFSGSLAGWASSTTNGAVVNFSAATTGNVPDLTVSTSMPSPVVSTTQGTVATNEQSLINFTALAAGSALTVAGLTLNATVAMSASQVASAFASIAANGSGTPLAGSYTFSGSLSGWSSGVATTNSVVFTAAATGNVTDISLTNSASAPQITTSQGANGLTAQLTGINIGQYVTSLAGNSLPGTTMSQPIILSPATSTTGTIVINNTSISVTLTSDLVANRAAIVKAINAQTKTTGVTAVNNNTDAEGISLTSLSTQSISVNFPQIIGSSSNPTINPLTSATTGIRDGRVNAVSKLVGSAMTAPTTATTGTIKINGVSVDLSLGTDATVNSTNILAAINAKTANTGVTASANAGDSGITLTAADGRAIKTDLGATLTEAQTGLKKNVLMSVDMTSTSNDTLLTLRDKINAVSGMTATIVQGGTDAAPLYYLSVKSGLGVVNNFYADVTNIGSTVPRDAVDTSNSVPATDGLLGNYYSTVTEGQDAKINVDGVSITSSTNTFDKAIPNVIVTTIASTNGNPVKISSQTNTTALTNAISSLVNGYNQVITTMSSEMNYNMSDPTQNGGLANNAIARTLIGQLRNFTTQSIAGYDSGSHTLADIGVKTNRDGTLTLDSATFSTVLSSNPDLVAAVLASKQSVSDSRLAPGGISSTAKTGVYTVNKQVLPPTVVNTSAVSGSNATAAVQFYSLKSGDNITIGGLTFTSSTDLTASDVAAAYANLSAGATTGPSTAKGNYSGSLTGWVSGLLNGTSLTFTASTSGSVSSLTASGTSLGWTINGDPAILSGNTLTASSTSSAAGISLFIPSDLADSAAEGFTASLNYSQGIIERFNNMINDATGTTSSLQNLTDDENKILSDLTTKQATLDARMAAQLTRYQQQFSTLTALLNKAKSTQSQLTDFQTAWSNSLKGN